MKRKREREEEKEVWEGRRDDETGERLKEERDLSLVENRQKNRGERKTGSDEEEERESEEGQARRKGDDKRAEPREEGEEGLKALRDDEVYIHLRHCCWTPSVR